jgi:hypothetical protein
MLAVDHRFEAESTKDYIKPLIRMSGLQEENRAS